MFTLILKKEMKETNIQFCAVLFEDMAAITGPEASECANTIRHFKKLECHLHEGNVLPELLRHTRQIYAITQEEFERWSNKPFSFKSPCIKQVKDLEEQILALASQNRTLHSKLEEVTKENLILKNKLLEIEKELKEEQEANL